MKLPHAFREPDSLVLDEDIARSRRWHSRPIRLKRWQSPAKSNEASSVPLLSLTLLCLLVVEGLASGPLTSMTNAICFAALCFCVGLAPHAAQPLLSFGRHLLHSFAARGRHTDSLTGIGNRQYLMARIDALIDGESPFWLGVLDLDDFRSINGVYGQAAGDAVLREVARRIAENVGAKAEFARIDGDEFAFVFKHDAPTDEILHMGAALLTALRAPYAIGLRHITIQVTLGFLRSPSMDADPRHIYERARCGLDRAKQCGQTHMPTLLDMHDRIRGEQMILQQALRDADLEHELHLVFQPQFNLAENRVVGFEALARWQNIRLGAVRPDVFIPAAESAGLIQEVTSLLFGKTLDALELWPEQIFVSFNLSAQDLCDRAFIFSLVSQVLRRGILTERVEFEITETAVMKDIETSGAILRELSGLGFRIALDDFGTGYSSFQYIDRLPLDKLKIDKSFVRKAGLSSVSREIVAGLITLCGNLQLKCVLEGIETREELDGLMQLGAEFVQGYLFGRPMPLAAALRLISGEQADLQSRKNSSTPIAS